MQAVLKLTVAIKYCHDIAYVGYYARKETELSFLLFLTLRIRNYREVWCLLLINFVHQDIRFSLMIFNVIFTFVSSCH